LTYRIPEREAPVISAVILIGRLDGGLLELDGWGLASTFFAADPSSLGMGSSDPLCGRTGRDEIEIADVEALNRTMRARTAHGRSVPLIRLGSCPSEKRSRSAGVARLWQNNP
jgi:hypothetical protein